jgi:hypothetical protein
MPDSKALRVERGERILLSPESPRFRENYREVRPRTASELREVLGLSAEAAQALRDQGARHRRVSRSSAPVAVEELESQDEVVRARAHQNTGAALEDYVYAMAPESLAGMELVFEKYLEKTGMVLRVADLPDIEVADGSTLVIPEGTDVVRANNITLHGSARIVCIGAVKLEANSIVGTP